LLEQEIPVEKVQKNTEKGLENTGIPEKQEIPVHFGRYRKKEGASKPHHSHECWANIPSPPLS